ncbi:MAG: hypothetical protein AAF456_23135, partial [Planctomycetota bacterium]
IFSPCAISRSPQNPLDCFVYITRFGARLFSGGIERPHGSIDVRQFETNPGTQLKPPAHRAYWLR